MHLHHKGRTLVVQFVHHKGRTLVVQFVQLVMWDTGSEPVSNVR